MESVRSDGRIFLSSTTLRGVVWIRLAVLSFRTHLDTVRRAVEVIRECAEHGLPNNLR